MTDQSQLSKEMWTRYEVARDQGHQRFLEKAERCKNFIEGNQWVAADKAFLDSVKRPALTINKIFPVINSIMATQIATRSEISFQPRSSDASETADVMTKVFKYISDQNHLNWKRTDVFKDGMVTGRGFYDVRVEFDDSMKGEVRITHINPKNVLIDPDADEYDPATWSEVFVTKWVTPDDIGMVYGREKQDALSSDTSMSAREYLGDTLADRDRFGDKYSFGLYDTTNLKTNAGVVRRVRLLDRQYRKLHQRKMFVLPEGDLRPVPDDFTDKDIKKYINEHGWRTTTRLQRRIRWTVCAGDQVLHDDWSPYHDFTIVPYFPFFNNGSTIGHVENLLDPQDLHNKSISQELHVINTSANSGWIVKTGALTNTTPEELEEKGGMTGQVIEVTGDIDKSITKINPNQVPQGLDRMTFISSEAIKEISGVSDSMLGQDRADVSAKAIQAKQRAGSSNLEAPLDMLVRSDHYLARVVLNMIQMFYTEERLMIITHSEGSSKPQTEEVMINQETPEGQVINDLTLGEYAIVVTTVPARDTLADSQFEQAIALVEAGIPIPPEFIINASRLMDKKGIIASMQEDKNSPEAQAQAAFAQRMQEAEVAKVEGEAANKHTQAELNQAKAASESSPAPADPKAGLDAAKAQHDADLREREFAHRQQTDAVKIGLDRQKHQNDMQMRVQEMQQQAALARAQAVQRTAAQVQRPTQSK